MWINEGSGYQPEPGKFYIWFPNMSFLLVLYFTTEDLSSSHAYLPYLSQGSVVIVILTTTRSTYFPKRILKMGHFQRMSLGKQCYPPTLYLAALLQWELGEVWPPSPTDFMQFITLPSYITPIVWVFTSQLIFHSWRQECCFIHL